jgi:hypothetical protein
MFFHLPFGHAEARIDSRTPRDTACRPALEIRRRVRKVER